MNDVDSKESHKERHQTLHRALDELVADFIRHTGKRPSTTPLTGLMLWSHEQCEKPTEDDPPIEN